jgi:hypothetical protein
MPPGNEGAINVICQFINSLSLFLRMAYKLTVIQAHAPGQWSWQIVDSSRPGWVKRSLLSFRSSGLATAAGIAEVKSLSRKKLVEPPLQNNIVAGSGSSLTSMFRSLQRRWIGAS